MEARRPASRRHAMEEPEVSVARIHAPASRPVASPNGSPWLMLMLATVGFAVNFWAWALISPLGPMFRDSGALGTLSESDVALLVAVPVLVGSLGRIVPDTPR